MEMMNASATANTISQRRATRAGQRQTTLRTVLRVALSLLQVIGLIATFVCLFLTGPSVWTLLVGLAAAALTKASLAMMDQEPEFAQDDGAIDDVLLLIQGRTPRDHENTQTSR